MSATTRKLFNSSSTFEVQDVKFYSTDDDQTLQQKLKCIVQSEMYQFGGLLDADGMVLEINRAALDGAGIQLEDIVGKPFWEARWWAVSKDSQESQRDLVRRASQGEFIRCDVEIYGQAAGNETIIIDYSLRPIKDQNGKVVFLLPEGRNITDKKLAEAEIARRNEELQQLLEKVRHLDGVKSDFFANVSHELRTPLTLILGPVEAILTTKGNLTETQQRNLAVIHRNASTLVKHVNDLLDLSKIDAGKMTLNYERIDLANSVRLVAAHFDALALERSLSYVIASPDLLVAEADPEKFDRILLNLLSNAFKFTPPGGRIKCALELSGSNRLLLSVQDSGPGIKPDMRAAIFDRFGQAQGGTTRHFGGTGLGLSIAKDFVGLHGGTISVTDAPGGGALFQVEIPLCAPVNTYVRNAESPLATKEQDTTADLAILELQDDEFEPHKDTGSSDRPRVLVAEDNVAMLRFVTDVLGNDYCVIPAADGLEALSKAISEPPDLVVTDLMMPELGGDRLVDEMRKHPTLTHVPVLVLSARADEALRLKLLGELVQDYVTKPFSPQELKIRVRNLVSMKRARDALQKELATQNEDLSQLTDQLISSRRELQQSFNAMLESEHRWWAVYENSAVGIAITDISACIIMANPACERIFGYSREEILGISLREITNENDREITRSNIAQLLAGTLPEYHLQKRYERKDGSIVWANTSVSLIQGTESMLPMLIVIVEDISERKLAEEALTLAQVELARVSRVTTMGELAASIAHEVNQPLAAIVANGHACLRWLAADPSNIKEANDATKSIIRDSKRASEVISRIRGFFKRDMPQRLNVSLNKTIRDVIELVQGEARSHGILLRSSLDKNLPYVLADNIELQQVVLNLVINGIEAMTLIPRDRRVLDIATRHSKPDEINVSIRDSGTGLSEQHKDQIFDAFYTTKPQGMGMGLAISRSIVEAHGGRLWVTPNEGAGVTFQFSLPISI